MANTCKQSEKYPQRRNFEKKYNILEFRGGISLLYDFNVK